MQSCDFGTRREKGTFSDHNGPKSNDSWIDLRIDGINTAISKTTVVTTDPRDIPSMNLTHYCI